MKMKSNLGAVLFLVIFWPVGLFLMWKYTNWNSRVKWGITAVFAALFLLGYSIIANAKPVAISSQQEEVSTSNTPTSISTPVPKVTAVSTKTPASTKVPEKKIEAKKTPEQTFESICNKYGGANNCSYYKDEVGTWSVTQLIQAKEDFMLFSTSKQISRDFIFAVYATKLPMAHASITITMQGKYYRAGLGADMADTQPDSTWTSNEVGPTIFYDFLKSQTNGSAGDGLNSTYVETNLD